MAGVPEPTSSPLVSRRTVLRRGAVVAAGAVWVAPALTAFSMSAASADTPSSPVTTPPTDPNTSPTPTDTVSIDPSETTFVPGTTPPASTSTTTVTATATPSSTVVSIPGSGPGQGVDAQGASRAGGALAFTGVEVPIAATVAVGLGAVATGVVLNARRSRPQHAGAIDRGIEPTPTADQPGPDAR